MILELIAMSSLVCNKQAFDEVNKNISSLWNGKDIILDVKKYNPLVFPITSYKYKKIDVKEWSKEGYIKGLFILVKSLQNEIEDLKEEIKNLKEDK